jgi:hypothetical protein
MAHGERLVTEVEPPVTDVTCATPGPRACRLARVPFVDKDEELVGTTAAGGMSVTALSRPGGRCPGREAEQ